MTREKNFSFSGIVEPVNFGQVKFAVFLPHHITLVIPAGRLKARAIINGATFSVSILFRRDKGRFFPLKSRLLRSASLGPGDPATITFTIIPQEKIDVPDERETALTDMDKSKKVWKSVQITGKKFMAGYIDAAKNIDSRLRMAFDQIARSKMKIRQPDSPRRRKNG